MKITHYHIFNKSATSSIFMFFVAFALVFTACVDAPLTITTNTEEMMGEYIEKRPNDFSEFQKLLDTTQVLGLLNAYGEYTLFAPDNDAMKKFFATNGKSSLEDFQLDTLKKIVYDHIIKGYIVSTEEFIDGLMPYLTMSERFVATSSKSVNNKLIYTVNENSSIIQKDIKVSNGIIHVIDEVLNPSTLNIVQAIAADDKFKIFYAALLKTELWKKLQLTRDDSYDPKNYSHIDVTWVQGGGSKDELPVSRKYGYTVLLESDQTLKTKYGINNLDDLINYTKNNVYHENPSDANINDYTDSRNALNKFVAYHLINKKLTYTKFIDDYDTEHMIKTFDMYEYIETLCPGTLIEIKKERSSGESNLINKSGENGNAIRIVSSNKDNDAINGVYHEIDNMLIYDKNVAGELSSKRLRMDAASFFPELTNNNMRYYNPAKCRSWVFPPGYIERLKCSESTRFCYLNAYGGYLDYQGDEIYLKGMYDFTMETPPIPAGTWEIRFSYQPTGGRGAAQLYWDGYPCGIPLDLRILANDPLIGYEEPGSNVEDYGYDALGNKIYGVENDKMMRNRGYMKGPNTYKDVLGVWYGKRVARQSNQSLRRILGVYTFDKTTTHKFSVKAVREGQFMMDFLEFVPLEIIESEGID